MLFWHNVCSKQITKASHPSHPLPFSVSPVYTRLLHLNASFLCTSLFPPSSPPPSPCDPSFYITRCSNIPPFPLYSTCTPHSSLPSSCPSPSPTPLHTTLSHCPHVLQLYLHIHTSSTPSTSSLDLVAIYIYILSCASRNPWLTPSLHLSLSATSSLVLHCLPPSFSPTLSPLALRFPQQHTHTITKSHMDRLHHHLYT